MPKLLIVVIAVCLLTTGCVDLAYHAGERNAWNAADQHYSRVIGDRVSVGIAGYKRVQGIRERAAYEHGFTKCQEQF